MPCFLSFPNDIIFNILSRCSVEDIMRWRCACKAYYQVPKHPDLIEKQLESSMSQHPCILLSSSVGGRDWVYLTEDSCKKIRNLYEYSFACIQATCNGLLCLTDRINATNSAVVIHNPITNDSARLPLLTFNPEFGFGFGYDLVNKKYKVVRIYNVYPGENRRSFYTAGEVITLGESSWRQLDFPCRVTSCRKKTINTVFCKDAFYWAIHDARRCCSFESILAFNIIDEKFHIIKFLPSPKTPLLMHRVLRGVTRHIRIFNFGEFVGLAEESFSTLISLRIWKMTGNNTTGYRLGHQTLDTSEISKRITMSLSFIGLWYEECFLFTGRGYLQVGGFPRLYASLGLVNPQKNISFAHHVVEFPQVFQTFLVVPSLVSPTALIGSSGGDTGHV